MGRIRARVEEPTSWLDKELVESVRSLDGRNLRDLDREDLLDEGELEISVSVPVLLENVAAHVSDVYIRLAAFFEKVVESYRCPDLLSALYLQFYLMIRANKPMGYCEHPNCRTPFLLTSKKRRFCCETCRSGAR